MIQDLEEKLTAARDRVRELSGRLSRATMDELRSAWDDVLMAERNLAAARGEQYAKVIDIGPRWDSGAPLPHLISNGSRAFVVCLAREPDPGWDGSYVTVVSAGDALPALFLVIELRGCSDIRFGGPNDEAIRGHPLHGRGLAAYQAHQVVNSAWIEERIRMNSVHPQHSETPFRELQHYVLLFHDEMLEALAHGIATRLVKGTTRDVLTDLASSLID